jgi:hypothetical protein
MKHNIVCLKWGTLYGPDYVNKLFCAVRRNITIPFTFHCFTECSQDIHPNVVIHNLPHTLPGVGWWQKLYLFSEDAPLEGRVLYIDLDTLITGNIDEIVLYNKGFICLRDLFLARMNPKYKDKFGFAKDAVGSGVLSWEAGKHTQIWKTFIKNPQKAIKSLQPHGDQKWIQKVEPDRTYWQDILPGQIVSFKVHCRQHLPKNARVVCYHGKPSIPESINTTTNVQGYRIPPTKWVKDYWYDERDSPTFKIGKTANTTTKSDTASSDKTASTRKRIKARESAKNNKAKRPTNNNRNRQELRMAARRRRGRKI